MLLLLGLMRCKMKLGLRQLCGVFNGVHICALINHRQTLQAQAIKADFIRLVEFDSYQRHFSDYEAC